MARIAFVILRMLEFPYQVSINAPSIRRFRNGTGRTRSGPAVTSLVTSHLRRPMTWVKSAA